jgi:hypothetical protein
MLLNLKSSYNGPISKAAKNVCPEMRVSVPHKAAPSHTDAMGRAVHCLALRFTVHSTSRPDDGGNKQVRNVGSVSSTVNYLSRLLSCILVI